MAFVGLRLSQLLEDKLRGRTHCKALKCSRSREKKIAKKRRRGLQSSYPSGHQLCLNLSPSSPGGFPAVTGPAMAAVQPAAEPRQSVTLCLWATCLGDAEIWVQNQHSLQALHRRKQGTKMFMLLPILLYLATLHTSPPGASSMSVTWWALNIFYASQCQIKLYY